MNDSYLSGIVQDDNRVRQLCHWTDGWECDGLASVLTLVELVLVARAAEGAERPWLQASQTVHPALCRPAFLLGSRKHTAASSQHIITAKGVARKQIPPLSISVCINTCALTHRQQTGSRAVQETLSTLDFRCVRSQSLAHLLSTSLERRVGDWSRGETGLSSHLVRPGPTHCPPPLPCAQNIPGMLNAGGGTK